VIGCGITGAWIAYLAARAGCKVTFVEPDEIGSHASGKNPGGLNPVHGPLVSGPLRDLAMEAFSMHLSHASEIRELAGFDFSLARPTRLLLAVEEADIAELREVARLCEHSPGFDSQWLEPRQVTAIEPSIRGNILGGLRVEGNARVDARAYTRAVAAAAIALGARHVPARAIGLRQRVSQVAAVLLPTVVLECDFVVLATGPWCREAEQWLGIKIPVEPLRGDLLRVELVGVSGNHDITWRETGLYARGTGIWLGGTAAHSGFDVQPRSSVRRSILRRFDSLMYGVRTARVQEHIAALRPTTHDRLPIIGFAPGTDDVLLALGGGHKGMLLSAGMARSIVELALTGFASSSMRLLGADRFGDTRNSAACVSRDDV